MKICNLTKYDPAKGDILVLEDYHTEGVVLQAQHKRIEDAIAAIRTNTYGPHIAVVRVIELNITEIQTELPL